VEVVLETPVVIVKVLVGVVVVVKVPVVEVVVVVEVKNSVVVSMVVGRNVLKSGSSVYPKNLKISIN